MRRLHPRQKAIACVVRRFTISPGYPPTYRELSRAAVIPSTNTVAHHVRALEGHRVIHPVPFAGYRKLILAPDIATGILDGQPWVGRVDPVWTPEYLAAQAEEGTPHAD